MSAYDDIVAEADGHRAAGRFKEASITYGRALAVGGARDGYCRLQRGACARRVGETRLDNAEADPATRRSFLDQAARWLTKAEAVLDSAADQVTAADRAEVRLEQARTEEALARYLTLCGTDPARRLSEARRHRAAAGVPG